MVHLLKQMNWKLLALFVFLNRSCVPAVSTSTEGITPSIGTTSNVDSTINAGTTSNTDTSTATDTTASTTNADTTSHADTSTAADTTASTTNADTTSHADTPTTTDTIASTTNADTTSHADTPTTTDTVTVAGGTANAGTSDTLSTSAATTPVTSYIYHSPQITGHVTSDGNSTDPITDQTSSQSDSTTTEYSPSTIPQCAQIDYCDGPVPKSGHSITYCACPPNYLNIADSCCLNQNWIIGIACGSGGVLIIILVATCVCLSVSRQQTAKFEKLAKSTDADLWANPATMELPERNGSRPGPLEISPTSYDKVITVETSSLRPSMTKQLEEAKKEEVVVNMQPQTQTFASEENPVVATLPNGKAPPESNLANGKPNQVQVVASTEGFKNEDGQKKVGTVTVEASLSKPQPERSGNLYEPAPTTRPNDNDDRNFRPDYNDNRSYDDYSNEDDDEVNEIVLRNPQQTRQEAPQRFTNVGYQATALVSSQVAAAASVRPTSNYTSSGDYGYQDDGTDNDFRPQLGKVDSSINYNIKRPVVVKQQ